MSYIIVGAIGFLIGYIGSMLVDEYRLDASTGYIVGVAIGSIATIMLLLYVIGEVK